MDLVIDRLKSLDRIKDIELSNCGLSDAAMSNLIMKFGYLDSLEKLNLSKNEVGRQCLDNMMALFSGNKLTVDHLVLADCGINLMGFINLLKSL